jgi:two-component system chemotaxis response regulator CheB
VAEGDRAVARPSSSRYVPSADRLLASVARVHGARARAVVLSGMGSDGAAGLAEVRRGGGLAACQAPDTAVVASMPERAIAACAGAVVAAPEALPVLLAAGGAPE